RDVESALIELRRLRSTCAHQEEYVSKAAESIARFMDAERFEAAVSVRAEWTQARQPFAASDLHAWRGSDSLRWVYAVVPLRLSAENMRFILLGPRRGNRRYLSEDFQVLSRMAQAVTEEIGRYQDLEMQALVSEAELRALQAQINPHFLFNSLNALYGTIDRDNAEARRMVVNLSDVLRHALRSDRRYISLEEEIRIVRAYLEIERLRLGARLETEISIDPAALPARVPVLSIQPLVENAIKHGVAANGRSGYVRLSARRSGPDIQIEIANSGELSAAESGSGSGVGLSNVRRRLALCYGAAVELSLSSAAGETVARFSVPCHTV
ncbi:MAG: histidine kinase, partial [Acidobacteriaceae bacterium]|nr:histidine kinase [Acidobacteriaceae bacterium]